MSVRACLVFAALAVLVLAQPEHKPAPFLVVTKTVSEYYVVQGNSFQVNMKVANYGDAPAYDLVLENKDLEGKVEKIEQLDPDHVYSLNYSVTTAQVGDLPIQRALVTYALQAGDATVFKAWSNTIREEEAYYQGEDKPDAVTNRGTVSIVTSEQYDRRHTKYIKETIGYLFIGAISVFFPFFMYRTKQNQVDQLIRPVKKTK
jgi:hypothetical protein